MQTSRKQLSVLPAGVAGLCSPVPRFYLSALLVSLFIFQFAVRAASAQEYTLEQIRQGYLENINRIVTMDVTFVETTIFHALNSVTRIQNVRWVEDGGKFRLEQVPTDLLMQARHLEFSDGRDRWECKYVRGNDQPECIIKYKAQQAWMVELRNMLAVGLPLGGAVVSSPKYSLSRHSLATLTADSRCQSAGTEEYNGAMCNVLEVKAWQEVEDPQEITLRITVDPHKGFLPVRVLVNTGAVSLGQLSERHLGDVKLIKTDVGDVWFPFHWSMISMLNGKTGVSVETQVKAVQLNDRIPISEFKIPRGHSTQVVAASDRDAMRNLRINFAEKTLNADEALGSSPLGNAASKNNPLVASSAANTRPSAVAIVSTPNSGWWFAVVGIACLASGTILVVRVSVR